MYYLYYLKATYNTIRHRYWSWADIDNQVEKNLFTCLVFKIIIFLKHWYKSNFKQTYSRTQVSVGIARLKIKQFNQERKSYFCFCNLGFVVYH